MIGNPENAPVLEAHFRIRVAGAEIEIARSVEHRYIDHIYGEQLRPLAIVPPVGVTIPEQALVFASAAPRKIDIFVKANIAKASGEVYLDAPSGWHIEPATRHFELASVDEQTTASFTITPPSSDARGELHAIATVGGRKISSQHGSHPISAHSDTDALPRLRSEAGSREHPHACKKYRLHRRRGR